MSSKWSTENMELAEHSRGQCITSPIESEEQKDLVPCATPGLRTSEQHRQGKKRRRSDPSSDSFRIRNELSKSAGMLRRQGVSPNTLFFHSLPQDLKQESRLLATIGATLKDLKMIEKRDKKMAWATFASESECLDTLQLLRLSNPTLQVSLHRPKSSSDLEKSRERSNNLQIFEKRLRKVRANGGIGNTLLFRNLPPEISCEELENVLHASQESCSPQHRHAALRTRTALSEGGGGRNFWVVYASSNRAGSVFEAVHSKLVSFRCGKTVKIYAFVHDDSSDADEKKRRGRAADLGQQPSLIDFSEGSKIPRKSHVDRLEELLRKTEKDLVFLAPDD